MLAGRHRGGNVTRLSILLAALAITACRQESSAPPIAVATSSTEARLAELEKSVAELRTTSITRIAYLKPGSPGWVLIDTTGSMPLRVGLDEIKAHANGSEVAVQIGNPSSISLRECTLQVGWRETKPDGSTIADTWHNTSIHLATPLPAGDFATHKMQLPDIPPEKLGAVTIGNIECLRWQKAA